MKKRNINTYFTYLKAINRSLLIVVVSILVSGKAFSQEKFPTIKKNKDGSVIRVSGALGNTIPDFSYSGYKNSSVPIPNTSIKAFVKHHNGDATKTIQSAIDYVAKLKPNTSGFRGAVLLDRGLFEIHGTLYVNTSGVVLRGSSTQETILIGESYSREPIISVLGIDNRVFKDTITVVDTYIPLGSQALSIANTENLKQGDKVLISTPISQKWIDTLQMNEFGGETGWLGWKKGDFISRADREITKIEKNKIYIDAPLTNSLDKNISITSVVPYTWVGRIKNIGIENLTLQSKYDTTNPKDEQHRWHGVIMQNVENAWVKQVNFKHFSGGAVLLLNQTKKITVEDCIVTNPVSEIAEFRRNTFYTEGQQNLFQRCYSEYGYHDFAVGGNATSGPNVFLQCESYMPYSYSGSIGSWATGVLFDIVTIDGHALSFKNFGQDSRGLGWNAANSVIWESSASKVENFNPPTANNWAFGVWGQFAGNGHWESVNSHISPRSLFYDLLKQREKDSKIEPYILNLGSEPSSSPTVAQAELLTKEASQSKFTLKQWIDDASNRNPISITYSKVKNIEKVETEKLISDAKKESFFGVKNGLIVSNSELVTGQTASVPWWRGSLRERDIKKAKPHITRFVPGQTGLGYTDKLSETVDFMQAFNIAAIDHNYGLWYERRMDDHERVRRFDANVWAPFYEQPFNRSGKEIAWDHLSKYDLTSYNTWYWSRLYSFANLAKQKGKVLLHQQYFQHNILEAGAHWSSSPWRPTNNINETGFPEPAPYAGDKRIFLAEQFYDITHPERRKLHKAFIEKGLKTFKNNANVLQVTSAEYTGPLHFMQFWLDVISEFEKENENKALTTLSATKDVQDAILKDDFRSKIVDVIDIKYWYYKEDRELYAPKGGKNLAPRQHARKMKTGKETEEQVYRAVIEYKTKHPNKAVIYSTPRANNFGWAVLMAGGSLPAIPSVDILGFQASLAKMKPKKVEPIINDYWILENEGESYVLYFKKTNEVELDLSAYKGKFEVFWINPENGNIILKQNIKGNTKTKLENPTTKKVVAYIKRK